MEWSRGGGGGTPIRPPRCVSTTLLGGLILKRLILLSQLSPGGHREANKLVDKILKSVTDRKPLGNPSAFATTGVENARKLLTPKGEYYAGKSSYK